MDEQTQSWDDVARRALADEAQRGDDGHTVVLIAGASAGTRARVRGPVFACDRGACVWHGVPHPVPYHRDAAGQMWPIDPLGAAQTK